MVFFYILHVNRVLIAISFSFPSVCCLQHVRLFLQQAEDHEGFRGQVIVKTHKAEAIKMVRTREDGKKWS
jgi:hypothetical protein